MKTYADALDTPMTEVEAPKPLPQGTYLFLWDGPHQHSLSSQKQTPQIDITAKVLQPQEDVDREALAKMGGFADKRMNLRFFNTDDARFMLKNFLVDTMGCSDGMSLKEGLAQGPGKQFLGHVKHEAFKRNNGEMGLRAVIDSTAKV